MVNLGTNDLTTKLHLPIHEHGTHFPVYLSFRPQCSYTSIGFILRYMIVFTLLWVGSHSSTLPFMDLKPESKYFHNI